MAVVIKGTVYCGGMKEVAEELETQIALRQCMGNTESKWTYMMNIK